MGILTLVLPSLLRVGNWLFDRIGASEARRAQFVNFMQTMQHRTTASVDLRRETERQLAELKKIRDARNAPPAPAPTPEVKP